MAKRFDELANIWEVHVGMVTAKEFMDPCYKTVEEAVADYLSQYEDTFGTPPPADLFDDMVEYIEKELEDE